MATPKHFSKGLAALVEKYKDRPELVVQGVGIKLFGAIVAATPADTGRLRANWRASVGEADRTVDDPSLWIGKRRGGAAQREGTMSIALEAKKVTADQPFYLANSLPYVRRIEYEGWSHTKAPLGMVQINVMRFRSLLGAEVTHVRNSG